MICDKECFACKYSDCIRGENEDANSRSSIWRKNNPDKQKEIRKRQYINHIEKEKENAKKQYEAIKSNPYKLSEYREYKRIRQKAYREKKKAESVVKAHD